MSRTRLISPDDAATLTDLVIRNRESKAPTEPDRDESYYSLAGQRQVIDDLLAAHRSGSMLPLAILDDEGAVAGRITLTSIVRGPLQSAVVGYWVSAHRQGRGLAVAALTEVVAHAFAELGLHRLEAGTLVDNAASQAVLERCGFVRYGMAPRYLHVAGSWRDHVLYQVLADD